MRAYSGQERIHIALVESNDTVFDSCGLLDASPNLFSSPISD
jgi:hypothetical protein